MRCLYCGNELALLKKLTGGGEFCSEAHRQKYQEEYNRLALSRLLQAQPSNADCSPLETARKSRKPELAGVTVRDVRTEVPVPDGKRLEEVGRPTASPAPHSPPPPEPSFLIAPFEPALCPHELHPDDPLLPSAVAVVPDPDLRVARELGFDQPGQVVLPGFVSGWPGEVGSVFKSLEPRSFSRSASFLLTLPGRRRGVGPKAAVEPRQVMFAPVKHGFASHGSALISLVLAPEFQENGASMVAAISDADQPVSDEHLRLPYYEAEPSGSLLVSECSPAEGVTQITTDLDFEEPAIAVPSSVPSSALETSLVGVSSGREEAIPTEELVTPAPSSPVPPNEFLPDRPEIFIDLSVFGFDDEPATPERTDASKTINVVNESADELSPAAPSAEPLMADLPQAPAEQAPNGGEDAGDKDQPDALSAAPLPVEASAGEVPAVETLEEQSAPVEVRSEEPSATQPVGGPTAVVEATPAVESERVEAPDEAVATREGGTTEGAIGTIEPASSPDAGALLAAPVAALPRRSEKVCSITFSLLPGPEPSSSILPAIPVAPFRVAPPTLDAVPIRPRMVFGAKPEQPAGSATEPVTRASPEHTAEAANHGPSTGRRNQRRGSQKPETCPVAVEPAPEERAPAAKPEPPPEMAASRTSSPACPPEPTSSREASQAGQAHREHDGAAILDDLRFDFDRKSSSGWGRMGTSKKVAIGAGLCLALLISAILLKSTFAAKAESNAAEPPRVETIGPSLITDTQAWKQDWNSEQGDHQISLFGPSTTLTDYRITYQGPIGNRSIGWVFRAANTKNYYVTRLEVNKAGAAPKAAVVHYAVINGENTRRSEKQLSFPVLLDTIYNVRTDVLGTVFSTYVQDQLVDSWTDERLTSGGFGTLGENIGRARFGLQQLRAVE